MRILLVHNPEAGSGEHQGENLIKALKRAGHKAIYLSSKMRGLVKSLEKKADLVLVAGGDGTVSNVALRLISMKCEIPLSVLPLGTANNFARTLGFCLTQNELIARLNDGKCDTFDVGQARGPWGRRFFFEGAGAGLFADYLQKKANQDDKNEQRSKSQEVQHHVRQLRHRIEHYRPREWNIELDGEDLSGRYLLWHAMNIRSVGPVLTLAENARTNDGAFDFISAQAEDRAVLLDYFKARVARKKRKFPLRAKPFRRMRLGWKKSPLHFDDKPWPAGNDKWVCPCDIRIAVEDSALRIWRVE